MWGSVVVLSLPLALNPVRLAIILLLISRPRPVQNLLACWLGNLTSCIPFAVVPVTLLHVIPASRSFTDNLATSTTVRHIQFGMGVFILSIAALVTVRSLRRRRAELTRSGGTSTSTLVRDSDMPPAIARLLGRAQDARAQHVQDAPTKDKSFFQRLVGRAHNAWESGSLWVAFMLGFVNPPAPDVAVFILAIIVASGAGLGAQLSAAILFIVLVLAVVEITLVSYLVAPEKIEAVLRPLHNWSLAHRRQVLIAMLALVGASLIVSGMGSL